MCSVIGRLNIFNTDYTDYTDYTDWTDSHGYFYALNNEKFTETT